MSVECTPEEVGLDSARLSNLMPALNNFIEEGELPSGEVLVVGPPLVALPDIISAAAGGPGGRRVMVEFGWGLSWLWAWQARRGKVCYRERTGYLDVASKTPLPDDALFRVYSSE